MEKLDLEEKNTIETDKAKIENKEGIIQGLQRLIFKGQTLEDNRTIEDYGIRNCSTLYLASMLR